MDDPRDNPAKLRTYRIRLYWPTLKRYGFLRLDAVDAWDANAFVRLNYGGAHPFAFEAWDEAKHGPELRAYFAIDDARIAATPPAPSSDNPVVPTEGAIPEGPQG
jgi:hypothetical protein